MSEPENSPLAADGTTEEVARHATGYQPAPAPSFAVGDSVPGLSSWLLERKLGGGGFGEVWLARHEWKNRRRAVKFCTHAGARHRIVTHEKTVIVRVMTHGKHPNVVPLLEYNLDAETPWLMYEYVDGGTLAEVIRQWRELSATRRIMRAVATLVPIVDALSQLHQLKPPLVHRDLKPQNVLMAGKTPLITDFGIGGAAAEAANKTGLTTDSAGRLPTMFVGRGTPQYAPPEQLLGSRPDPRDDVYSLGIIAYQMFTGDVDTGPGTDVADELRNLGVPRDLVSLVVESVSFNPDRRPEDAREWESRLSKFLVKKPLGPEADSQAVVPASQDRRIQAEADYQRGKDYDLGRDVFQDRAQAREWYEKAALRGHPNAQNNLGVLYARGEGGEQDYAKAREWYEKAALQGHAAAQFNLAGLYASGQGVEQDYVKAREWYEKAALQGHDSAQSNLARLYKYGLGGEKNLELALEWFRKAAANGNERAKKAVERLERPKE